MKTDNQALVIFGASGDLTARKLIPAVYNLYLKNYLPEKYAILGVSRSSFSDESFRRKVVFENKFLLKKNGRDKKSLVNFSKLIYYQEIDTKAQNDYWKLKNRLEELKAGNIIFYLSVPPSLYPIIPENLASVGLNNEDDSWRRLIIEKPFGYDLKSAKQLNKNLLRNYKENFNCCFSIIYLTKLSQRFFQGSGRICISVTIFNNKWGLNG